MTMWRGGAAEEAYRQAEDHYSSGKFVDAIKSYTDALRLNPSYAEAMHSRGVTYYLLGSTQAAIGDYTAAIRLDFYDKHVTYKSRGQCLAEMRRFEQAVSDLSRALEIKPDYDGAYHERGMAYVGLKKYKEAIADFSAAIEFGTDERHVTYSCRARCYRALGMNYLADADDAMSRDIVRFEQASKNVDPQARTEGYHARRTAEKIVYKYIGHYATAHDGVAVWMLISTLGLCFVFNAILPPVWYLLLPAALLRMRLFMLYHDCIHGAFFSSALANKAVGYVLGFLVYTPFTEWKQGHQFHHRYSNNLDYPQDGAQTAPWTVEEYLVSTMKQRGQYKFTFGTRTGLTVVPAFSMLIMQRVSSTWHENIGVFVLVFVQWLHGWSWMFYELCTMGLTATMGFSLFHIQHTFEGSYKARSDDWNAFDNGLKGCSFLQVPAVLKYFTCGIEYHHIHHLNTKIPCYRLKECQDASGDLFNDCPHIYFSDYLKSLGFSLYDEFNRQYVSVYNYGGFWNAELTGKGGELNTGKPHAVPAPAPATEAKSQ